MKDALLAELGLQSLELKKDIDELTAKQTAVKSRIKAEMERRGTKGIITGGVQVTYVRPEPVVFNELALQRKLKSKWSLVTREVLDKDKLAAALQEGLISATAVQQCSEVVPGTAYVLVTAKREVFNEF